MRCYKICLGLSLLCVQNCSPMVKVLVSDYLICAKSEAMIFFMTS